jgi:hypothetical protein
VLSDCKCALILETCGVQRRATRGDAKTCPALWRAPVEGSELELRDLPLPEAWPHHSYLSTDASNADRILAIFAREGWKGELSQNGPPGAGARRIAAGDVMRRRHI